MRRKGTGKEKGAAGGARREGKQYDKEKRNETMKHSLKKMLAFALAAALAACTAGCGGTGAAQEWPTKPVTVVVGYAAGGGSDLIARKLAEGMSRELGQAFNILNVSGGSASIAGQQVCDAPADGYTMLAGPMNVASPWRVCNYIDAGWEDFYSLIGANSWYAILVSKNSQFKTYQDLIAYGKENPGKLKWGHSGYGSMNQVSGDLMLDIVGVEAVSVPYGGGSEAATKVIAGENDFTWLPLNDAADFINSGDLVALCVTSAEDMAIATVGGGYTAPSLLKDYPECEKLDGILGWGLHVPRDTDEAAMKKIVAAFEKTANSAEYAEYCKSINVTPACVLGEEADRQAAFMESFIAWGLYDMDMAAEGISPEDFDIPTVQDFAWPPNERASGAKAWPAS